MPGKGVDREGEISVVHAAGVKEGEDTAQHAEIHQKGGEDLTETPAVDPGQEQTDVHGDAAELEGEIPPVVAAAADREGQGVLLPQLRCQHQYSGYQEKTSVLPHGLLLVPACMRYRVLDPVFSLVYTI